MGVARLKKLLIVSHKSEQEAVLNKLQDASLVELKPYSEKLEQVETYAGASDQNISEVKKVLDLFGKYKEKKKPGEKAGKLVLNRKEYERMLSDNNFEQILKDVDSTEEELNIIASEITNLAQQIETLKQWSAYTGNLEDLGSFEQYTVRLVKTRCRKRDFQQLNQDMEQAHISAQYLGCRKDESTILIAYHHAYKKEAETFLADLNFEEAELSRYSGTVSRNLERLVKSRDMHMQRQEKLMASIREARGK